MNTRQAMTKRICKGQMMAGSLLLGVLTAAPLLAQQADAPPPGPYAAPGMPGHGFTQPWGQQPPVMGMSREDFQKQQAERRAAMDKRRAEMQARRGAIPAPQWPDAAESRADREKQMAEMRERHQQQMAKYRQKAPGMNREEHQKRFEEMKARHAARIKEIESQEKDIQKLWEEMQAKEKAILEKFEKLRAEREAFLEKMYGERPVARAPQAPQAVQQPPMPAAGRHYRPMPYGYAPWQMPAPYGPAR